MEITEAQYKRIVPDLPVHHGSVRLSNLQVLDAILSASGTASGAGCHE